MTYLLVLFAKHIPTCSFRIQSSIMGGNLEVICKYDISIQDKTTHHIYIDNQY